MTDADVIIVGAGAAGLIAARNLSNAGKKVLILEARSTTGGRIKTIRNENSSFHIEAGAEFIHGDAELTKKLLNEFNISYYPDEGISYYVENGKIKKDSAIKDFPLLLKKVNSLKEDMTFASFMNKYLNDSRYGELKKSVIRFIEGYDAADINEISTFALREEWNAESAANSFRIEGGYGKLTNNLQKEFERKGGRIISSLIVNEIEIKNNLVYTKTVSGDIYSSEKIIVTVPLGILNKQEEEKSSIKFIPGLGKIKEAFKFLGYGSVIKVFFEFKESFRKNVIETKMPDAGFIFSDTPFTAWWTQLPNKIPLLTGWLSGPKVDKLERRDDEFILNEALNSLSYILKEEKENLERNLNYKKSFNWKDDSFSQGAYAYAKPGADDAIKIITEPVDNKLYFAGEAFYRSDSMGTVEAALQSGLKASEKILS